jgi:UPF0716 protein FxsA
VKTVTKLFLLFTVLTTVELVLLFKVAEWTSWWVTVGMVFIPGLVGAWLAKREGGRALRAIRDAIALGREPASAILDGAIVLVAATLLLTPGVLTDVAGVLLLIPTIRRPVRELVSHRLRASIERRVASAQVTYFSSRVDGDSRYEVIDADDIRRS